MLPAGSRVIAAVSGGPDSVCLLHVLHQLDCQLAGVAHFNHKLRGQASDEDERFVADLARRLGVQFYSSSAPLSEIAGNLEQNARRARREFFQSLLDAGFADRIALGHTRDDQAETVLFRLLRGSGSTGVAGILPVTREGIIRPLLDVRRSEVLAYLREHNLEWREDATNASLQFARNRIRHSLLPQLAREWNPQVADALAQAADVAYEEESWWASEVSQLAAGIMQIYPGAVELCLAGLASLQRAPLRRLIRHAIGIAKGDLTGVEFDHIEDTIRLASKPGGSGRLKIPGLVITRSFDWLFLQCTDEKRPAAEPVRIEAPGIYDWPTYNPLIRLEVSYPLRASDACDTLGVTLRELELRSWHAGDRYCPAGRKRETKLHELFQRARVPSWRRASWPILTSNGKIVWAKEFGPAVESSLRIRELPLEIN